VALAQGDIANPDGVSVQMADLLFLPQFFRSCVKSGAFSFAEFSNRPPGEEPQLF
jgi:hypothetical protein